LIFRLSFYIFDKRKLNLLILGNFIFLYGGDCLSRYLIINADDFGSSIEANEAVERLFEKGWVTSTTVMAPCPMAEDAIHRIKADNRINAGLHLTTTAEWPTVKWGPLTKANSLCDNNGYFYSTVQEFLAAAKTDEVVYEFQAQLDFMINNECPPDHLDNHMGSAYGLAGRSFLPEVFGMCAKYRLPFRLPRRFEGLSTIGIKQPDLRALHEQAIKAAIHSQIGLPDVILHFPRRITTQDSYQSIRSTYVDLLLGISEGITEVYMHPCIHSKHVEQVMGINNATLRGWEYELLLDHDVCETLEQAGIKLISWKTAPFEK